LIQDVTPYLLNHPVTVRAMDDEKESLLGCTQWGKKEFVFTINIGIHNIHDWTENIELLIHELAHFREQSNAHCVIGFYEAVTTIGAKLAKLAIQKPRLFRGIETSFLPEKYALVPYEPREKAA
jgi:hypothetical protein